MGMDEELWWIPLANHTRASFQARQLYSLVETKIDVKTRYNFVESSSSNSSSSSSSSNGGGDSSTTAPAGIGSVFGMGNAAGFVLSKGAGFAGQVFGLYSTSRGCLVGIEEKRRPKFPFSSTFVRRFLHVNNDPTGPAFNFYTNHEEARAYLKRLKVPDMELASLPLHMAYKFFKERPALFSFVPSRRQVDYAKELLRRAQGRSAAQQFKGVPVFSSESLSVLVISPSGARWFRPHFFKKEELDGILKTSMEHHYQTLIRNRSAMRHNQLGDFPSDMSDDFDMMEAQEMQDFMEDVDEWGSVLESIMAKAAQIYVQDALDKAIFGNKWCRMLAGVQPKLPILVDSFEQRAISEQQSLRPAPSPAGPKRRSLLSRIRIGHDSQASSQTDEEEWFVKPPHFTVVAGVAGGSVEQVMRDAETLIQDAKDRIEKNVMPLENLFIADMGGPHLWSTPTA